MNFVLGTVFIPSTAIMGSNWTTLSGFFKVLCKKSIFVDYCKQKEFLKCYFKITTFQLKTGNSMRVLDLLLWIGGKHQLVLLRNVELYTIRSTPPTLQNSWRYRHGTRALLWRILAPTAMDYSSFYTQANTSAATSQTQRDSERPSGRWTLSCISRQIHVLFVFASR